MFKKTLISLAVASSLGLTGCFDSGETGANADPDYQVTQDKNTAEYLATFEGKVWPVFNPAPAVSDLPIPNDLIYGDNNDGTYSVADSKPPVTTAINSLSGASTVAPIDIKMSGKIDDSLKGPSAKTPGTPDWAAEAATQNVFLIELDYASGSALQALKASESPKPGLFSDFEVIRKPLYDPELEKQTDFIRIIPTKPLNPGKRYIVAILDEVTADGQPIVSSPTYTTLDSGKDSPKGQIIGPGLEKVRTLIDDLWEPIAAGTVNSLRKQTGGNLITEANIALSYSFTTSNDKEVLKYVANPKYWLGDQVLSAVRLKITKQVTGAAKYFQYLNDPENTSPLFPADWDLNGDGKVDTSDFDVNRDENLTPADFILADRNSDSAVNAADFQIALAPNSAQPFGYMDLAAAVASTPISAALQNPALSGCNTSPFEIGGLNVGSQALCVGTAFSQALAGSSIELPQPKSAGAEGVSISFAEDDVQSAQEISAALEAIPGSANVNVAQGSITLPYYLGIPDGSSEASAASKIQTTTWTADSTLAQKLNGFLKSAEFDLELAQGIGESDVVNSIYPFPEKTADISVPLLVMYPKRLDTNNDGSIDTPFDPEASTKIPVVIYQHGITTDRSAALSFGSALAAQGVAVVAIDQPLHGVDPTAISSADLVGNPTGSMTGWAGLLLKGIEGKLIDEGKPISKGDIANPQLIEALVQSTLQSDPSIFKDAVSNAFPGPFAAIATGINNKSDVLIHTVKNSGSQIAGLAPTYTGQGLNPEGATERHFGYGQNECSVVTKMNFTPSQYEPDSARPASGDMFINLTNFINTRDILRQGSVDLMTLRASIGDISPAFDTENVYFVGHSLGTLNGGAFVAAANSSTRPELAIKAANLLTPVAGTVRMLENSPAFAPKILGGLLAQKPGLTQATSSLQAFFNILQGAIDSVDPINFGDELSGNVLLSQIDGDNTVINNGMDILEGDFTTDVCNTTIPVSLKGSFSPLSGSEPLAAITGANTLDKNNSPADITAYVRFTAGTEESPVVHSTPVLANGQNASAVFGQMVAQTLALIQTGSAGTPKGMVVHTDPDPTKDTANSVVTQ